MDRSVLLRAALVQALAVAALSALLGVLLPHSFFENWGWIAGPAAWMACAAVTARVLTLPLTPTLVGAGLAGIPSVVFVILGLHWLGGLVAVVAFALWCAAVRRDPDLPVEAL
jgi:hypothetical protein